MSYKKFTILLVVLVVVLLAFAIVVVLSTQNPMVAPVVLENVDVATKTAPDKLDGVKSGEASLSSEVITSEIDISDWLTFR